VRPFWVEDEVGWGGGGELLKLSRDYGRCVSICFLPGEHSCEKEHVRADSRLSLQRLVDVRM